MVASNPTIVVGMHSSGTTLLSRTLSQVGVLMGEDQVTATGESIFFQNLNQRLLSEAGASWFRPDPFLEAVDHWDSSTPAVQSLRTACLTRKSRRFLGRQRWEEYGSLFNQPYHWGWKDPRNCLTLPLWLRIFPEAKVILLIRNGIDVSESLVNREQRFLERRWWRCGRFLFRAMTLRNPFANPVTGFGRHEMFGLWRRYLDAALNTVSALDGRRLLILRFEDLVSSPETHLRHLVEFVGLDFDQAKVRRVAESIDPRKSWAFVSSSILREFHGERSNEPLMKRFAYDQLPAMKGNG